MTYTIEETITDENRADESRSLVQLVKLDKAHAAIDFDNEDFVSVDTLRFETGWVIIDDKGTKVELTRLLMSCESGHNHGVYYQSPRELTLWEAMYAIGEIAETPEPGSPAHADTDKDGNN